MDIYTIVSISIGVIVGIIFITVLAKTMRKKPDGYIRINTDDPDKDTYTLELAIPFGELNERKGVYFRIVKE